MRARSSCGILCIAIAACSAGDTTVDPGDLELRDLLGIAPEVARAWNADQRAAARRVLEHGLRGGDTPVQRVRTTDPANVPADSPAGIPADLEDRVAQLLASGDAARAMDGAAALGVVRVAIDDSHVAIIAARPAPRAAAQLTGDAARATADEHLDAAPRGARRATPERGPQLAPQSGPQLAPQSGPQLAPQSGPQLAPEREPQLWIDDRWPAGILANRLPGRGAVLLAALATDAGHGDGPVIVVPAPQLAVIAAYLRRSDATALPRLTVNPVLLAALDPAAGDVRAATEQVRWSAQPVVEHGPLREPPAARADPVTRTAGNPYSFYGSVAECAAAQRSRCESCTPTSTCRPITNITDGNAECAMLGANSGRGYFLLCINLALAITSIDRCTANAAPACVRDPGAADTLATLENNASFLADQTCGEGLDGCLAQIFGPPRGSFPGLDAGTDAGEPPRSTSVNCTSSCDNTQNTSCNASPSCDCSGPSCNNSLSCDSACSSSNDQHGCGGNCDACTSSGDSDTTSKGCGGGSSSSSDGGCSGGGSNSGCGSSGCGSSGCGSSGCSSSGCGSSSGGSSNGCGSSGSSSKCSAATNDPGPGLGAAMSALWGSLPVALSALARRRARRRRPAGDPRAGTEETPGDPQATGGADLR